MGTTVAVRFPLGHYHATAWDRSLNEGAVEWPPSPWRLLRALVSTWYTRWPELPAPVLDGVLDALGDPPAHRTRASLSGHTRPYLPDPSRRSCAAGATDLTLDPFLSLSHEEGQHLLIRWDADLAGEQREVLAKLVELVPYVGRAESVCEMSLLDSDVEPDATWWRPNVTGTDRARLLAPTQPISRTLLEVTTVAVRKERRTLPRHTEWVPYARTTVDREPTRRQDLLPPVTAIRFGLHTRVPFKPTHGVLLADAMHRAVTKRLDGGRVELLGHQGAATDHGHAHWVPLSANGHELDGLLVWTPGGMSAEDVSTIIRTRRLAGQRGGEDGYEVKGFPRTTLLLQSVGSAQQVAPELCGPSRVWRSLTPYLPVRHHKRGRGSYEEFLAEDVRHELRYRSIDPDVTVTRERHQDRWALQFRRHRADERPRKDPRLGFGLVLEFMDPVGGPLMLGQLSHFGFGAFVPVRDAGP